MFEVHAVNAGDQRGRQHGDGSDGKNLDDLVLVDVDEADGDVHQEVDLVEQKSGVAVERVEVAQDLPRLLRLIGAEMAAAQQKAQRAAGVHHIAADASVQVFLLRNAGECLRGVLIAGARLEDVRADGLQIVVNAFEGIGRILGVGEVEREQYVGSVFNQPGHATRSQPQQAKDDEVVRVDGEQHVAVNDEGHALVARTLFVTDEKVGAQMQLPVFFLLVKPRGFLQILIEDVGGDGQAEAGLDPAELAWIGRFEIDPDGLQPREGLRVADLLLHQATILEGEHIEHRAALCAMRVGRGEVEKRRNRIALRQRIGPTEFDQGGEVVRREQQITGQRRSSAGTHAHRLQQQPRATGHAVPVPRGNGVDRGGGQQGQRGQGAVGQIGAHLGRQIRQHAVDAPGLLRIGAQGVEKHAGHGVRRNLRHAGVGRQMPAHLPRLGMRLGHADGQCAFCTQMNGGRQRGELAHGAVAKVFRPDFAIQRHGRKHEGQGARRQQVLHADGLRNAPQPRPPPGLHFGVGLKEGDVPPAGIAGGGHR